VAGSIEIGKRKGKEKKERKGDKYIETMPLIMVIT
jgi:hypothetical protein